MGVASPAGTVEMVAFLDLGEDLDSLMRREYRHSERLGQPSLSLLSGGNRHGLGRRSVRAAPLAFQRLGALVEEARPVAANGPVQRQRDRNRDDRYNQRDDADFRDEAAFQQEDA